MISILYATYNGELTIGRMLGQLVSLEGHRREHEIIVVDNGSTDRTAEIVRSFESQLPLRYLRSAKRGKNAALNLGLGTARGDLIVFTDDDILVSKNWLKEFEALADEHPSTHVFGGRIVPEWPGPIPAWIVAHVEKEMVFAIHPAHVVDTHDAPWMIWGGNMMVRAQVFREGFRFDESVGPAAGWYGMGGETEFTRRVCAAGHRSLFSNRPVVRHIIREGQFAREWILARARRFGMQLSRESRGVGAPEALLFGLPRWRLRLLGIDYLKAVATGAWFGSQASFRHCWSVEQHLGALAWFRTSRRASGRAGPPGS